MKKLLTIALLALIGLGNAIYLTNGAYELKNGTKEALFCDINSTFSCTSVFTHDFSWIFGIPFPLIAMIVYPILFAIAILGYFGKIKNAFKILLILAICGLAFNGYIITNEFFVSVFCPACLACTFVILIIGILSAFGIKEKSKEL